MPDEFRSSESRGGRRGRLRYGFVVVALLIFSGALGAQTCAYTLSPSSGVLSSSGGSGSFMVNTSSGCRWTATSGASWVRIVSGQSGSGPGQVSFAVDQNNGDARTTTITAAGQTFTVTQASLVCSIVLSPSATTIPVGGGTATFNVSAPGPCAWSARATATWITIVSGGSGAGAGVVGISAAANPGADSRSGAVTVSGAVFSVTQAGSRSPIQISANSIANAANYTSGSVSPGLLVVIAVPGIGPAATVAAQIINGFFATQLGETRVLFDGVAAPMMYAASGRFGAIVPYGVADKTSAQMQVEFRGVRSNSLTLPVAPASPGLFSLDASGSGPGAILDPEYNLNSADNPAPKGSVVLLYATGEGQTSGAGVDGKLADVPLPKPLLPVGVTIDGLEAEVLYAGAAPGLVAGVMQVNVRIPEGVRSGAVPVLLRVGPFQSQRGVTVAVE